MNMARIQPVSLSNIYNDHYTSCIMQLANEILSHAPIENTDNDIYFFPSWSK